MQKFLLEGSDKSGVFKHVRLSLSSVVCLSK